MRGPYKPYVPKTTGELWDLLGSMMLNSPKFEEKDSYFPERNIDTEFFALKEGLKNLRSRFGEERYAQLDAIADRMRAHFEADLEDVTEDTLAGRALIYEMEDIIRASRAARRRKAPSPEA